MYYTNKIFSGRKAVVTGSSSGIGYSIATALAAEGCDIVLHGIEDEQSMKSICDDLIQKYKVTVLYYSADLSIAENAKDFITTVTNEFGKIDILVNNAGIQHVSPVEDFPERMWNKIIDLNLNSSFYLIKGVIPDMKERGFGRIINIASAHGLIASPFKSAYVAAKHGIVGLTKCIALEVAKFNITVNAICPGYVLTPLLEQQIPETAKVKNLTEKEVIEQVLLTAQPTQKFVTTEQVSSLTCFLCKESSASITGAALTIDGGWTAQ